MKVLNKYTTKWYTFHKDIRHETKDYGHLKKEDRRVIVKRLIRQSSWEC